MSTIALDEELAQIAESFSSKLVIESPPFDQETTVQPSFDGEDTIKSTPSDEKTTKPQQSDEETVEYQTFYQESDDEEFSFSSTRFEFESISADDMFYNGQITPVYPFFDKSLLTSYDYSPANDGVTLRPPVKTILVETPAGTYGEFAGNSAGDSPGTCEKSNSTGFSNMWRFREMGHRSNSDGRDAFVFMKKESEMREKAPAKGPKSKISKKEKGKTPSYLAHYVESRERREKDNMRTYLPYKPGFFGIFTSKRGGLSKNVHPY